MVSQALQHLGKVHFGRSWSDESLVLIAEKFANYDNEAMVAAVKRIMLELSPTTLPPLSKIAEIVTQEQKKINQAKSPAEPKSRRENDKDFEAHLSIEINTRHNKLAYDLCIKTAAGMPLPKQLDACEYMHKHFPNHGWHVRIAQIKEQMEQPKP